VAGLLAYRGLRGEGARRGPERGGIRQGAGQSAQAEVQGWEQL